MKIGTLTFHWTQNYGAVLQAYALQHHLKLIGCETEIINYLPLRTIIIQFLTAIKNRDVDFFKKTLNFKRFRRNELLISKKRYFNNKSLFNCSDEYSAIICGSDQIWNMSFTKGAEGKPTLSYFLNFAGESTKRIAYATSFGSVNLDQTMKELIKPELEKFSAVSVRENTAVPMLEEIGIKASVVIDPTLLLNSEDYSSLIKALDLGDKGDIFSYIIHSNQKIAHEISKYVIENYSENPAKHTPVKNCDIYEWLYRIKNCKYVVTNSFHGTVFSLIFHKPFLTVAIPGSGMNDRLTTLLEAVGLSERFLQEFDTCEIDKLLRNEINWNEVDLKLKKMKAASETFLAEALKK